ncbi:hypothetical protein Leryth_017717 [Lithospermum erythrorhizon]|nr:hypothetical protein Leryth_017717 [Lithospermum erythrorhizon]
MKMLMKLSWRELMRLLQIFLLVTRELRDLKEMRCKENDDPIELEYEKEYEMKDKEVTDAVKTRETGKTNKKPKEIVEVVPKPNQKTKNGQPSSKVTKSKPPLKKKVEV